MMNIVNSLTKLPKLRIHICPIGYEIDRIVQSVTQLRADKVWLIAEENSVHGNANKFIKQVTVELKKKKIPVKMKEINRDDLFDNIRGMKEIFDEEKNNEIHVNVSAGSKIQAIASIMACMIFKNYHTTPYYVKPKRYGKIPDEPQSFGVKAITSLPDYTIQQPNSDLIKALNIIKKKNKLNKKHFAELSIDNNLFDSKNDKVGQSDYGKLNSRIVKPLKDYWKYIEVNKIGLNDWIELTDSGNDVCKFLIEDVKTSRTSMEG